MRIEKQFRKRLAQFGLANASWSKKEKRSNRAIRFAESSSIASYRFGDRTHCFGLSDHSATQRVFDMQKLLALAFGAKTYKLQMGHRGANQPVKDLETGKVEITSQNHGFCVDRASLPSTVIETHKSLFDGIVEGMKATDKPVFSVQYHPEASPGPQDSHHLFHRFTKLMADQKKAK